MNLFRTSRGILMRAAALVLWACGPTLPARMATVPEGFGAATLGGAHGRVLLVTSLSDENPANPAPGTLRWAVAQRGPRLVKFRVAGTIALKDHLKISEPFITIDGEDAPGEGICLKDYSVIIQHTEQVILRYLRVRRGDVELLKFLDAKGLARPKGSNGLDCVSLDRVKDVLIDHCSLSWSCDEIFGITRAQNVSIQWCLIAEPLTNPKIHPYGNNHAFGLNISSSTLSLHHNLISTFVYRGPQFEANDNARDQGYAVKLEAVNNLVVNYQSSGSRYSAGIETGEEVEINYHFIRNRYLNPTADQPDIQVITKYGATPRVHVYVEGNLGPNRDKPSLGEWVGVYLDGKTRTPLSGAEAKYLAQKASQPLFAAPVPIKTQPADKLYDLILDEVGCNRRRDAVDTRIINEVRSGTYRAPLHSQTEVGGWPALDEDPASAPPGAKSQ